MRDAPPSSTAIHRLNALLRRELAAVATYERAAYALIRDAIPELNENRSCHIRRSIVLTDAIRSRGGIPVLHPASRSALIAGRERAADSGRTQVLDGLAQLEAGELSDYRIIAQVADAQLVALVGRALEPAGRRALRRIEGIRQGGGGGALPAQPVGGAGTRP